MLPPNERITRYGERCPKCDEPFTPGVLRGRNNKIIVDQCSCSSFGREAPIQVVITQLTSAERAEFLNNRKESQQ